MKLNSYPKLIASNLDLEYCEEDGFWFTQYHQDDNTRTSQSFESEDAAMRAYKNNQLEWSDWD